ncbi:MAG: hypothetical protein EBY21_06805 [Alphaproteobacteria bacterium]|nr:hypothetical protein [Alphaproteobacteria bacterium]
MFVPDSDSYNPVQSLPDHTKWTGALGPALLAGVVSIGGFFAYSHGPKDLNLSPSMSAMTSSSSSSTSKSQSSSTDLISTLRNKLAGNFGVKNEPRTLMPSYEPGVPKISPPPPVITIKSIAPESPNLAKCAQKMKSKPETLISRIEQSDHNALAKTVDCYVKLPQKALCDSNVIAESQTVFALYYRAKRMEIEADKRTGNSKTTATAAWTTAVDQNVDKGFRALIARGLINPQDQLIQAEPEMAALARSVTPGTANCTGEAFTEPVVRKKPKSDV